MRKGELAVPREVIAELCRRYAENKSLTAKELAAEVFISSSTMRKYLQSAGIEIRRSFPENHKGKFHRILTPEQLEDAKRLYWGRQGKALGLLPRLSMKNTA